MNCFVIMPFAVEYDDVYAVIKSTVEQAVDSMQGRCFRLDENRPAGRITDRLVTELRSSTLCIADITDNRPNVMWETGYAMALGKPVILIAQSTSALAFDIKDMECIEYNRTRLSATLAAPLKKSVIDTVGALNQRPAEPTQPQSDSLGPLLAEIAQLKSIVAEAVQAWKSGEAEPLVTQSELELITGHWFNTESESHVYIELIDNVLLAPYCFRGNERLTGFYFGWKRIGEYWFAKYRWVTADFSGFSFLRMEALDRMTGAWWESDDPEQDHNAPPKYAGVQANWIRQPLMNPPPWAQSAIDAARAEGISSFVSRLTMQRGGV